MSEKRPFMITFIGDISILTTFLLLLSLFPQFLQQLGIFVEPLPIFASVIVRVCAAVILLIAAYGYLRLKRWGYWLMVIISAFPLVEFIIYALKIQQSYYYDIIMTVIGLLFILPTRKYFGKKTVSSGLNCP